MGSPEQHGGFRLRFHGQLMADDFAAFLVLPERIVAPAGFEIEPHRQAVALFAQRVERDQPFHDRDRRRRLAILA